MKQLIVFLLASSSFIVFGCSDSEDEVQFDPAPISFSFSCEEVTRGTPIDLSYLQQNSQLVMYAVWEADNSVYINKTELSYNSNTKYWEDGRSYYWPIDVNEELKFVSYAPENSDVFSNLDIVNHTIDFKVSEVVSEQVDFLGCNQQSHRTRNKNNGIVQFTYVHLLARVGIIINNNTGNELKDVSVAISGAFTTQGTRNLLNEQSGSWSKRTKESVTYFPELTSSSIADNASVENTSDNFIMVIPNGSVSITFTLNYTENGEQYTKEATITKKLEQKKLHTFNLNVNASADASAPATRAVAPLEVATCVEPWE